MSKRSEHPPLSIKTPVRKHRKSEGFPVSPTDAIISPCTQKLYNLRSCHSFNSKMFSLEASVHRKSYPGGDTRLILGSSSVGRRAVVDALEWKYERMSPDIDEKAIRSSDPMEMPVLIAQGKAKALMKRLKDTHSKDPAVVITADQIVLYKGVIREKPDDAEMAVHYLSSYNFDKVSTVSAVVVTHYPSGVQAHGIDVATVYWGELSPAIIDKVVAKGAVLNSAGGFCVEDPDLNECVASLDGTVDSIMGLPVALTERLIEEVVNQL